MKSTARGFEPLQAEPNGFRVHLLNRSDTLSWVLAFGKQILFKDKNSLRHMPNRFVVAKNEARRVVKTLVAGDQSWNTMLAFSLSP